MGYAATWKVLEEIIIEFRKRGITIPASAMNDLKSAKTMIKLMDAVDKDKGEMAPKIEQYLSSVEAYLVTEGQKSFSPERIDEWLRRLDTASFETCAAETKAKEESRFIPGLPRDQKWLRVKPIATLPAEKLKQLAEETKLSSRPDKDGHLIVYGKAEDIREFIKKMTAQAAKE